MTTTLASHLLACPVVFISTVHNDRHDIMTATAMFVSETDPLLVVSVAKGHLTAQLIEKSGIFSVAAAGEGQEDLYEQINEIKGGNADKFKTIPISTLPRDPAKPLIPKGAAAWFDCQVIATEELEKYIVIVARVTAYEDLEIAPMIWQKEGLFTLKNL